MLTCGTLLAMKELNIMGGHKCLVDDDVWEWAHCFKWKLHKGGYAQLSSYNLLHRLITGNQQGFQVHHINENKLDNRRENLTLETPSEHQKHHYHRIVDFQKSRQKYPNKKPCSHCGETFMVNPRKRKRNKCCSFKCAQSMRVLGRKRQAGTLSPSSHK